MARRKESGFELMASLPWPVCILLGLIAFLGIRFGIGSYFSTSASPVLAGMGKAMSTGIYAPFAWMAFCACWMAALVSFLGQRKRKRLLETQTGIDSIRAMDWQNFELLVGEAFRRQGYSVVENGLGGADGGVDLFLHKNGQTTLVQCKQWRTYKITVNIVREMFGLLTHHGAAAVKIVALGDYTPDARRFVVGKPIELIDGQTLLASVRKVQISRSPERATDMPLVFAGSSIVSFVLAYSLSSGVERPKALIKPLSVTPMTVAPAAPSETVTLHVAPIINTPRVVSPAQPVKYADTPLSDAELREWKRKNAEAMKILEKTTPEVPLSPPSAE
ncbi:restriction endonuclease [Dyella sp. 20L07]|uniref:restriction endonuclease n=1 Tax=Dyella sp. 20L07 TaxID=3384240 RepID=UPI003D2767DC